MSRIVYLFVLAVVSVSCDFNSSVYNEHHTFDNNYWSISDKIEFQYTNTDTITVRNLYIDLRNNDKYAFSNLYLVTELQAPTGIKFVDTLEYMMADKFGKWLGSGASHIKHNKLVYKAPFVFKEKGVYQVKIKHAMRKRDALTGIEKLQGVVSVGMLIE